MDPGDVLERGWNVDGTIAIGAFGAAMPATFQLFQNCRNTLPIATTTSLFVGMLCPETLSVNGPEVRTQWYSNPQQQIRQVSGHLNYLLGAGVAPHEIFILSKRKLAFSVLALGLRNVTVGLRTLRRALLDTKTNEAFDSPRWQALKGWNQKQSSMPT